MEFRCRASPEQFVALAEFMESYGDIARPQPGLQGRIKVDRLWRDLGETLNSIDGGATRPIEKWKKVWADWKTKTKKKAFLMRRKVHGTAGVPSSGRMLTGLEERVLNIMGLSAVIGQVKIEKTGFDDPPSVNSEEILLDIPRHSIQDTTGSTARSVSTASTLQSAPSGELPYLIKPPSTPPEPLPMTSPPSPPTSASRLAPSPSPSHTPSMPRHRPILRARRRTQNPFERATSEFVAVEHRRLQLEEIRERNHHEREIERLRLESKRIEMDEYRNEILNRLVGAVENLIENMCNGT